MNRNRLLKFLERKPRIKGVTGFLKWPFLEKRAGVKDSKQNQICKYADGHTTPWINSKARCYDSYVDRVYLRTTAAMEDLIKEANESITELLLISMTDVSKISGKGEEESRQRRRAEERNVVNERVRRELLTKISGIKAQVEMVDEKVIHHVEAAENVLHSHVLAYWRGILKASDKELENYPKVLTVTHSGWEKYVANRDELLAAMNAVLKNGGKNHEES